MYPFLVYSVRVFHALAQSRTYSEALVAHKEVIPLLWKASLYEEGRTRLESDLEGRRLALQSLNSLAWFGLWPNAAYPASSTFCRQDLPQLLGDEHAGIRDASADLWARLNLPYVKQMLLIGHRLESERMLLPGLWKQRILTLLFPFLSETSALPWASRGTPPRPNATIGI